MATMRVTALLAAVLLSGGGGGLLDDGGGGFSQAATDRGDEHGAEHGVMDPPNSSSRIRAPISNLLDQYLHLDSILHTVGSTSGASSQRRASSSTPALIDGSKNRTEVRSPSRS